ncbi:acetyl-CoA synthetase-like protein [Aspergillus campestris IBT 28561]|uniref:Acetyl-CoA synthetase-like protein n=1 Tax=Aspergillus campestris (strain IBT 28561) TaxID=1392248 RepID=A0A2I1CRV1_ASPC2|nr:acetyl-CoA synthetase-like protein [Aspergillus campestris IBT 28561]PKY00339.1 acetyl-CoA synthetase-like protein [Aspergillus campestris IBT 28561]
MSFRNLQHLLEAVSSKENTGKIISYPLGNTRTPTICTYAQLLEQAQKAAWILRSNDAFRPGSVLLLHFKSHWDNILWFWAAQLGGFTPAMSTAFSSNVAHRTAHLEHLSKTLMDPGCLTRSNLLSEFAGQDAIHPVAIDSFDLDKAPYAERHSHYRDADPSDTAVLMLTSGSTGNSKAVALAHQQILAAVAGKSWALPVPQDTALMNWVGLDHVAGLTEIHLNAMHAQQDQVHVQPPDMLGDVALFLDLIDRHAVSRTFAPNFFLAKVRSVLQHQPPGGFGWNLSRLRYIVSGGEANVTKTCDEVSTLLAPFGVPRNVIIPGFGMTETCAGSIYSQACPQYDLANNLPFASVGRCIPGMQMRVTEGDNEPVPAGATGNLEISGAVVFQRYFNNPEATEASFTSDGWFKTGDRATICERGYLTLMGRAKETMIVNGMKYNPSEIESAIDEAQIPGLASSFTCCFSSFPPGGETEEIFLVYLPTYSPEDMVARAQTADRIAKTVLMSTGSRPQILPLDASMLQKSALGKLSRSKIKTAYEKGDYKTYQEVNREMITLYRAATRQAPQTELERQLLAVFTASLPLPDEFDVQTPIFDMGISSIELIKLKKNIEEHLELVEEIPMITLMTKTTVRALAAALQESQAGKTAEYSPAVTLQSGGDKAPLWLVHPGVGEIMVFLNLAKFITDRPVYGLRARGFNEGEKPFSDLNEVIRTYHTAIKEKQPMGPYALAGYSYGSMLAFEVAKVLEGNGDEVRFVGSFNLPPHIKFRMRQLDFTECLLHLSFFLDLMTEERSRELSVELEGAGEDDAMVKIMENVRPERMIELALSQPALIKWAKLAFAMQSMACDYDPLDSIAGMDVFYCIPLAVVASSKQQWLEEHLSKWSDFTRSEPRFHSVAGAHYTMLSPEHVFGFQKTLRGAMEARGV